MAHCFNHLAIYKIEQNWMDMHSAVNYLNMSFDLICFFLSEKQFVYYT